MTIAQGIVNLQSHMGTFKVPRQYTIYNMPFIILGIRVMASKAT